MRNFIKNLEGRNTRRDPEEGVGGTLKGGEGITARPYIPPWEKITFCCSFEERKPASQSISKKIPFRKEVCLQSGFSHVSSGAMLERINFLKEKRCRGLFGFLPTGGGGDGRPMKLRRQNRRVFPRKGVFWGLYENEGTMQESDYWGQPMYRQISVERTKKRFKFFFPFRTEETLCCCAGTYEPLRPCWTS